jgi:hypothetical protein
MCGGYGGGGYLRESVLLSRVVARSVLAQQTTIMKITSRAQEMLPKKNRKIRLNMDLVPFALMVAVIAGCLLGILHMEGLIDFEFEWLNSRRAAKARAKAGFPGYIFLRNYKRIHEDRVQNAIRAGSLVNNTRISDQAFDS